MSDLAQRIANLSPQKRALLEKRLADRGAAVPAFGPIKRFDGEPVPSLGQERLWFLEQIDGGTALYNIPLALRLKGALNLTAVKEAIEALVERHETLRAVYHSEAEALRVLVRSACDIEIPVVDLATQPDDLREACLRQRMENEAAQPILLDRDLMLRAALFRLSGSDHVLQLTIHHIASDGWSIGVLLREFMTFYNARASGTTVDLPPLPIRYSDYAHWQRETFLGESLERLTSYWRSQLTGSSFTLEIPTDHPRPATQAFSGAWSAFTTPAELDAALKGFCRSEDVTPFMVLLASWFAVLGRLSGQTDICIGSPVAARTRVETEPLVGFFTNTLVLRGDLSGEPTFREFVKRVRGTCLDGYANQEMPLEKVIEALNPPRDLSRSPLFQVMFVLQNAPSQDLALHGLDASISEVHTGTSKFDLTIAMQESGSGLNALIEYSTDLFEAPSIARLWDHFCRLLASGVAHPEQPVWVLPLLSDEGQRQLLVDWNATELVYPRETPLAALVEAQVDRAPDAVAVTFGDESITYRQLNQRANQLARELVKFGAGPDQPVGVCLERSIDMIAGLLAVIKAGSGYVPLDPHLPTDRLAYMIGDSGLRVLLSQRNLRADLPPCAISIVEIDDPCWKNNGDGNLGTPVAAEHLAYTIYTSGSTGKPKGVELTRGNLTNLLYSMRDWLQLTAHDCLLAVTTISFDIAGVDVWLPLLVGARTIVASREDTVDGERLQQLIQRHSVTFLQATPVTWWLLLESGWQGKQDLQIVCTGEAMPRNLASRLFPMVGRLWNLYGPTETTIWSTGYLVRRGDEPVLIGRPVGNTQCYILDERLQPVPVGVVGELYLAGDGVGRGYHKRPELTAEKFVPDPFAGRSGARMYRTGDLARYLPDGNIECLGRTDHQVKIRGFRIELGEIESILKQHSGVKQTVVMAREDMPGDKRLVAYIVPSGEQSPDRTELKNLLKQSLPEYMIPADYVVLQRIPISPNGKIDRKALPPPVRSETTDDGLLPFVTPRTAVEEQIAGIWATVLKRDRVSVTGSFFDMGGHSLSAMQVLVRIRNCFAVEVPIKRFFEGPTIESLAVAVNELRALNYSDEGLAQLLAEVETMEDEK